MRPPVPEASLFFRQHRGDPGDPGSSPEGCRTLTPPPRGPELPLGFALVVPVGLPHSALPGGGERGFPSAPLSTPDCWSRPSRTLGVGSGGSCAVTGDGRRWEGVGGRLVQTADTQTQSSAQPSIGNATSRDKLHPPGPSRWGGGGAQGRALPSCPLRRDGGEVCVCVAVTGKGLSCPAWGDMVSQGRTGALPVGTAHSGQETAAAWALLWGLVGPSLRPPAPPSPLDDLLLEGRSGHTCLTLAVGAGPLTPRREAPRREAPPREARGCGAGADCVWGEQVTGTGAWAGAGGLVVFVLGPVFEDAGELHVVEVAFLVDGGLAVHLVHFLVCEAVAHGGEQLPKVVLVDKTWGQGQGP